MAGEQGNKAMGKTKQVAGRAIGDPALEREGKTQETTGKAQGVVKDAGRKVEDALGKMGSKLAERRRKTAETRDREGRPDRDRPRRELDRDY